MTSTSSGAEHGTRRLRDTLVGLRIAASEKTSVAINGIYAVA